MNRLGRISSRRLRSTASNRAAARAPIVTNCPTACGRGRMLDPLNASVFTTSNAPTAPNPAGTGGSTQTGSVVVPRCGPAGTGGAGGTGGPAGAAAGGNRTVVIPAPA